MNCSVGWYYNKWSGFFVNEYVYRIMEAYLNSENIDKYVLRNMVKTVKRERLLMIYSLSQSKGIPKLLLQSGRQDYETIYQ